MEPVIISGTKQEYNGVTYYLCGSYFQRCGVRLHRRVWESAHGTIPTGFHVHHKDGNRANNQLDNLGLLPGKAHASLHMKEPQNILRSRESVKKAIAAAPAWHSSVAGLAWHTERGKRNAIVRQSKEYKCEKCGKLFDSKYPAKYCSNACKTAARAASGIDDVQRQCEHCGGTFTVNKYSGQRFCGRPCARVARWAKK